MKKLIFSSVIILFGICAFNSLAGEPKKEIAYTQYNIWRHAKPSDMRAINYKFGYDFIPAGTAVYDVRVKTRIRFKILETDEQIEIRYKKRYHPGIDIKQYANYMFGNKKFEELAADLKPTEIEAIKEGILIEGMSKKAVIMSYGPPPEHRTPSLKGREWVYWMHRWRNKKICFDKEKKTINCKRLHEKVKEKSDVL